MLALANQISGIKSMKFAYLELFMNLGLMSHLPDTLRHIINIIQDKNKMKKESQSFG